MAADGEYVELLRRVPAGVDVLGNDVSTYETIGFYRIPVYSTDANGYAGNEIMGDRDLVIMGFAALFPRGTDIQPLDRARVRGELFEVDGHPNFLHSFFTGWRPGVLAALRRVEG